MNRRSREGIYDFDEFLFRVEELQAFVTKFAIIVRFVNGVLFRTDSNPCCLIPAARCLRLTLERIETVVDKLQIFTTFTTYTSKFLFYQNACNLLRICNLLNRGI